MAEVHRIHRVPGPVRGDHSFASDGTAQGVGHAGGPDPGEESMAHRAHRQGALVAGVGPGVDGLPTVAIDRGGDRRADDVERPVPAHRLEPSLALRARAQERGRDPFGAVHPVEEPVDLGAELTGGVRVVGIASEAGCHPVGHGHDPSAGVRAVVMTGTEHGPGDRVGPGIRLVGRAVVWDGHHASLRPGHRRERGHRTGRCAAARHPGMGFRDPWRVAVG